MFIHLDEWYFYYKHSLGGTSRASSNLRENCYKGAFTTVLANDAHPWHSCSSVHISTELSLQEPLPTMEQNVSTYFFIFLLHLPTPLSKRILRCTFEPTISAYTYGCFHILASLFV